MPCLHSPPPVLVNNLLEKRAEQSWHLFSGIRGYKFVYDAFRTSLTYTLHRALVTERPNTYAFGMANGKPLWLHYLRYRIQDYANMKHIDKVFAMGSLATSFFRSVNKAWQVYPFCYCTSSCNNLNTTLSGTPKLIFVGSLSLRKNVGTLMRAIAVHKDTLLVDIVGDGPERSKLEKMKKDYNINGVSFLGSRKNSEVADLLLEHDVLVLPSVYDGWGAVVNEALMRGLYVIVSNRCGASDLVDTDNKRGIVFRGGDVDGLAKALKHVVSNISAIRATRAERARWAEEHIGGDAVAKYMVDCLEEKDVPVVYMA